MSVTHCINPATLEKIGEVPVNDLEDVRAAMERARAAQAQWAQLTPKKRAKMLARLQELLIDRADALARCISEDNGKTRVDAMATEVLPCAMAVPYYCKMAPRWLKERKIKGSNPFLANKVSTLSQLPFGVVGIISPWNYPLAIPFSEVLMALLAGNGVLLKVATQTQKVGKMLEQLFLDCELPEGLFSYINLPGAEAGEAFFHVGVDKLFFTGSVPVGKALMAKAAETLTPVSLELGGNDPMIVCEDANLERAVAGALWAGFQNAGQSCGGVERIYVHARLYEPFLERLGERVRALRVGQDRDYDVDLGAMTTARQVEQVEAHVSSALKAGARLYATSGAVPDKGQFCPAQVLTEVDHTMAVMQEESFGPVVGVMPFSTDQEALALANDSHLGLTASVWSMDPKRAHALAAGIRAGVVMINDHLMSHGLPETPWGGLKESGIGRTHGELGFAEMTQPQCVVHDRLSMAPSNLWWHPHSRQVYDGLKGLLDALYTSDKVSGVRRLSKILPKLFRG